MTRHLAITINLDGRRLRLGHATGGRLGADLIAAIDPTLDPRAEACGCDTPPNLSDACTAKGCGMCTGYMENAPTPVPCDHDCHPIDEIARLKPGQEPPDSSYLEQWMVHWRERALKAEARNAGAQALVADARRRELAEAARWRDCAVHGQTLTEYQLMLDRLNAQLQPYEQLRSDVVGLAHRFDHVLRRAKEAEAEGATARPLDLARVIQQFNKAVVACNRGLEQASARSRARKEAP